MCGVCAGNPSETGLGDVVVAETAFEWDEGRHSPSGFEPEHFHIPLDPLWLRTAQDFVPSELPSFGSASEDEAMLWLLERLHRNQEPREHPARGRYFPPGMWEQWLALFEARGLITRNNDQAVILTRTGTQWIKHRLFDDVDGPTRLPFRVLAGPMASGNAVIKDPSIWPLLMGAGARKVAAVDMEAATVATVARESQVARWLVAKGVMDHANIDKDDRYRQFAARASAEVLFALLATLLPGVPRSAEHLPPEVDSRQTDHRRRRQRVRRPWLIGPAIIAFLAMTVLVASRDDGSGPPTSACPSSSPSGSIPSNPMRRGKLSFCPVVVNGGSLPITGPFGLAGQILGPQADLQKIVLFVRINPSTCDTLGKPGAPGWFLITEFALDVLDGRWSYVDNFGGQTTAVTFERIFEYASAQPGVKAELLEHISDWRENGISDREMPAGIEFLSKFIVPAGEAPGQLPCRGP